MESILLNIVSLLDSVLNSLFGWITENIANLLYVGIIIICAVIATRATTHVLARLLSRTIREDMYPSKVDRDRRLRTLNSIATTVINFVAWAVAVLMILNTLGVNTAPLLASAGIISVALGFGAQSLVKDFMTGMFIIAENQYRVGDYVEIQNVKGTVKAVTMRTTVVKDDDGSIFHIPNGSIIVTGNHTMGNNKVSLELSATTDTDIEKLRMILDKTGLAQSKAAEFKEAIMEPIHFRRIKDIAGGAIVVRLSGKVRTGKQGDVRSDYLTRLQKELVKNKIALK